MKQQILDNYLRRESMKKTVSVLMSTAMLTSGALNTTVFAETIANEMWGVSYPENQM